MPVTQLKFYQLRMDRAHHRRVIALALDECPSAVTSPRVSYLKPQFLHRVLRVTPQHYDSLRRAATSLARLRDSG